MYAVRQLLRVEDNKIVLDLSDFPSEYAEVIVLPAKMGEWGTNEQTPPSEPITQQTIRTIRTMDTSRMTEAQRAARERTLALLAQNPQPGAQRRLGLFDGLVEMTDDFNDPLPDEEIYWGSLTNEFGVNIDQ